MGSMKVQTVLDTFVFPKTGNEFWREKAKAEAEGLTQKQFNDRMNNPDLYQLEDPISNRSHQYELPR